MATSCAEKIIFFCVKREREWRVQAFLQKHSWYELKVLT